MRNYTNAWFINFNGIGNGIMTTPILRCFEQSFPKIKYYHTENPILSDGHFNQNLKNLRGFSPISWRRFDKNDWPKIKKFIENRKIDLIINLRNEGPDYDKNYYEFKKLSENDSLTFWDLDFKQIKKRKIQQSIVKDILFMLKKKGVNIKNYGPEWLPNQKKRKNVGLGINASQINKKWPYMKWADLCKQILKVYNREIILFAGTTSEDLKKAKKIKSEVKSNKIKIIYNKPLYQVAKELSNLECFIGNDTGLLHMAYANKTPIIGIYTATDPKVWAPYGKAKIVFHSNNLMHECHTRKRHCGNCGHYYESCPIIDKHGDNISSKKVFNSVKKLLFFKN